MIKSSVNRGVAPILNVRLNNNINKKVLLRERKRHTARRVVTTPSVVLTGYLPDLAGGGTLPGYPTTGYPPGREPPQAGPGRVPPVLTWPGGYPTWVPLWAGYPPGKVPPLAAPGRVPPPPQVDRQIDGWKDRRVSKHYLPVVLRTRAVKIICVAQKISIVSTLNLYVEPDGLLDLRIRSRSDHFQRLLLQHNWKPAFCLQKQCLLI